MVDIQHIEKYSEFIKVSFNDLVKLTNEEKEVFLDLYYNRTVEFNEMQSILKNIRNRGDNILILGYAGTGKSSFMYKVFYEIENMPQHNLYPIIVDYRDVPNKNYLIKHFIENLKKYFAEIDNEINTLKTNNDENINENIYLLKYHLSNLKGKDFKKHLIILLDDFDYIEQEELFDVLELFAGFGVHKNVTLVLSARPDLYTAIKEYDNRLEKTFTREIHKIVLARLDIKKLISRRLGILILNNKSKDKFSYWWNRIINRESAYIKLLRKMGLEDVHDLEQIEIPFTGLYLNFIKCITNHNNREIFDIVHDSILFILKEYNNLESVQELDEDGATITNKEISKENTLKLFFDNEDSNFRIIDINRYKSKNGNSLYFNVLEGIKSYGIVHETFLSKMKELGHNKDDIEYAIKTLKLKTNALISPKRIIPSKITQRVDKYPEFNITKKGDYYLTNIAYWDEYISRCGHFGESLQNII